MDTKKLRQKILDLAIHGKLVPQDPNDEPASVLLERIRAEKERLVKEGKIKKSKATTTSDTPHYENVPFEIPSSWEWTTLGHIGIWQSGGTPSRSNKSYYGGNIPWLKTGDLNDGLITYIPENITEEAVANSSAKLNPEGSVLIAMYGATIGKLGILTFPATTNQACCACIQYDAVIQDYLFYFLLSQRNEFIAKGGGGAQPNISKEIIVGTMIPIPPLAEQKRIVCGIKRWFDLIDQIEQGEVDLRTTIKMTKTKILDLAIHGKLVPQDPNDEPVSVLLKRINPNAEITCDNGQYGKEAFELPNTWVCCRLGDVISIKSGDSISVRNNRKGEYPIYGGNGINGYFCDYNVESDTIVIGRVGFYCGSVYKTKSKAWVTDNAFIVCYKNIFNSTYLKYVLEWLQLSKTSNSTAQPVISGKGIYPLLIPLPPLTEQQRIVYAIDTTFAKLDAIMESL